MSNRRLWIKVLSLRIQVRLSAGDATQLKKEAIAQRRGRYINISKQEKNIILMLCTPFMKTQRKTRRDRRELQ